MPATTLKLDFGTVPDYFQFIEDDEPLWGSIVGSHMWRMQRPDSDFDGYIGYAANPRKILLGRIKGGGINTVLGNWDVMSTEISAIIQQLLKGNINHILGVLSPINPWPPTKWLAELQDIVTHNFARSIYHSVNGLARHNLHLYFEKDIKKDVNKEKKLNQIGRVVQFGISVLVGGRVRFQRWSGTHEELIASIKELEEAHNRSYLPERVPEAPFVQFLLDLRREQMKKFLGEENGFPKQDIP